MNALIRILASWGGLGYSPVASGTIGTLGAIPLYLLLARLPLPLYLACVAASIPMSSWVAGRACTLFGEHDSGKIVIDEVVGYLVTMCAILPTWPNVLAGFLLFRFFDIVKIPPARQFDRQLHNGWGVVLDDVAAGVYAWVALFFLQRFWS